MNEYLVIIGFLILCIIFLLRFLLRLLDAGRTIVVVSNGSPERTEPSGCGCETLLIVTLLIAVVYLLLSAAY